MDPFDLERNEKWMVYLQTEEGKEDLEKKPQPPAVEISLSERLRFEAWANDVLDRMSKDLYRGDKK